MPAACIGRGGGVAGLLGKSDIDICWIWNSNPYRDCIMQVRLLWQEQVTMTHILLSLPPLTDNFDSPPPEGLG